MNTVRVYGYFDQAKGEWWCPSCGGPFMGPEEQEGRFVEAQPRAEDVCVSCSAMFDGSEWRLPPMYYTEGPDRALYDWWRKNLLARETGLGEVVPKKPGAA